MKHRMWILAVMSVSLLACTKYKTSMDLPEGTFIEKMTIRSKPSAARIFINDKEVGKTPFKTKLWYSDSRMINIKAVPIYPHQYTQNIYLMVPPMPKTMTIYMDHQPVVTSKEQIAYNPPEKRLPEIVTEVDTVFVPKVVKKEVALTPPVVYFDWAKYDILPSEETKLQEVVTILKSSPDLSCDIYGYADITGREKANLKLSLNRANRVREYLVKNGIDISRMRIFGSGQTITINGEGFEMELSTNRRVQFTFYKMTSPDSSNTKQ